MRSYLKFFGLILFFLTLTQELKATTIVVDTVRLPLVTVKDYVCSFIEVLIEGVKEENIRDIRPYLADSVEIVFTYDRNVLVAVSPPSEIIYGLTVLISRLPPSKVEILQNVDDPTIITLRYTPHDEKKEPTSIRFHIEGRKVSKIVLE